MKTEKVPGKTYDWNTLAEAQRDAEMARLGERNYQNKERTRQMVAEINKRNGHQ